jgi:hypothetical protein
MNNIVNNSCRALGHCLAIAVGSEKVCARCKMTESQIAEYERKRQEEIESLWKLDWGFHKGERVTHLRSLGECKKVARNKRDEFARMGYKLWYATAISPTGEETQLTQYCSPYQI